MHQQYTIPISSVSDRLKRASYVPHPEIGSCNIVLQLSRAAADSGDSHLYVAPDALLDTTGQLTIEEWVMISHGVHIWTHKHVHGSEPAGVPFLQFQQEDPSRAIRAFPKIIRRGAWLYSCTVLPTCTEIAECVVVATGAVVVAPILEPFTVWAGVPARKIRELPHAEHAPSL